MKITVKRHALKSNYTIGRMYVDGEYLCDTLEDTDRFIDDTMTEKYILTKKIAGCTAIPTGTYKLVYSYSPRFQKKLPEICNVKGFKGIRIHTGNTDKDSSGCLLVGENKVVGKVINSAKAMTKLTECIKNAELRNEPMSIEITYK